MKSRTSFFNGPVFRKNLTRFAPLWGGYILCLLLGMLLMLDGGNLEYWFAANLASMCSGMAVINLGYALLVAQILFGDLYNTRMCYALHAMPLRRECWFTTHVLSGFFFSLVPTAVMSAACIPLVILSAVVGGWQIPLYFLLASNLEFVFFFGLATLCALCAGNRMGMAVLYGIGNFLSYLLYFLVDTLVTPMYYGVITQPEPFVLFCPVAKLMENPLLECWRHELPGEKAGAETIYGTFTLTDSWIYLVAVAVVGIVLLLLARGLYRRRRLECAGDFLAIGKLAPVFMVVFAVTVGTVFQFVRYMFLGTYFGIDFMLPAGVAVGWFAGRMLLERHTRVFRSAKNWLGLLLLIAVLGGTLYGLSLDPFGVEDWMPEAEDVQEVTISNSYRGVVTTDDPAEIADILAIQEYILREKLTAEEGEAGWGAAREKAAELPEVEHGKLSASNMAEKIGYRKYTNIRITYTMRSGWTVSRDYWMWLDNEMGDLANGYFSRVGAVFYHNGRIQTAEDLLNAARTPEYMFVGNYRLPEEFLTAEVLEGLLQAVVADCEEGTMTQARAFHEGFVVDTEYYLEQYYRVDVYIPAANIDLYFDIYADSSHCMQWLKETGIEAYCLAKIAEEYQ